MKLRQLQFVKSVAETGSFSKAAEQCCATQPTLSNAIAQLEEELGGKLFDRTTRKVGLTAFGAHILGRIEEVLRAEQDVLQAAKAYHDPDHKLLRIGFSPLVDMGLLNHILQPFCHKYQDIEFFFKECLLDDLSQRLRDDVIDIAIIPASMLETGYEHRSFYKDPLFYLAKDGTKLPQPGSSLKLADLPSDPVIMTGGGCGLNGALERLFQNEGATLTPYRGQAMSYPVIEEWADLGIGAGILPQAKLSQSRGITYPLALKDGSEASFEFSWVWPHNAKLRPHIALFTDYIETIVPSLITGSDGIVPMRASQSS
ncbi:MAG: LysR family transcriptional regulator [Cohaesibacter sp.]|jgi:DNA-binding transcriptional LysR family regulator|nr:LysR family transcriptional regulator [Cohaesibacter sp.]